jgi:PIN domain nuclease of toxin-antitoxin system
MALRYLLDTHILLRGLLEKMRLTREQSRVLEGAVLSYEPLAISAVTLMEIALAWGSGDLRLIPSLDEFCNDLRNNPIFELLPMTCEVALEMAHLGALRDPADRAIVATARVHGLRLITSDQRIIESNLVSVVE